MNVPKLRFGEFVGEWKEKSIGDVLSIGSGKDYKHLGTGNIPVFGTGGLMSTVNDYLHDGETVCIGRKGTIDKPMYYNGKLWTVDTLFYTHSFDETSPKFIFYAFQRINWKEYNEASGVPSLSKSTIEKILLITPNLFEQQKIADFLSAVDDKITALTAQKTALTQYKQGMMQRIFAQTLRFKDDNGADYPEWESVNFGDVFTFKSTNSYSRECLNYEIGTTKNIHYGDIHTKFKTLFDITNENIPFVNNDISLDKINDEAFCRVGDLVIADASEDYKDIGKSIEIINLNNQRVIAGLHTFLARPVAGLLSTGFIGYAMQSAAIRLQIMTIAQGTKVLSISTGRLAKVQIPLPHKEEQTKIAQFLTELDDKINAVDAQIQSAQQWKQGLLQQMFV